MPLKHHSVIHFEAVKASSLRELAASEQRFFQGEVLVPDWIPPHLIKIPKVDIFTKCLELRGRLQDSSLAQSALKGEREGLIKARSKPKPRVSPLEVLFAGNEKRGHETLSASRTL